MRSNLFLIASLLLIIIAAPIVDAIACDDCKDFVPAREMRQCSIQGADHSRCNLMANDADRPAQQETGAAKDLCPVCANIGAATGAACCGAPLMIIQPNHLPKLIAFSDPWFSITKPPQN